SLGQALKLVGKPSPPIEQAEKENVQREADAEKALETGRCPKCDVEMEGEGYAGSDGDEAWWLTCPQCILLAFPGRGGSGRSVEAVAGRAATSHAPENRHQRRNEMTC